MNKILVHINYFEQGQSLERACRLTRELGGDGIEFRRKPGSFTGSDLDYLDEISAVLDKYPLEWISFGAPGVDLMVADPAQREKEIQDAERFYRKAASRFPLRIVNTFTGNLASPSHGSSGFIMGKDRVSHKRRGYECDSFGRSENRGHWI